MAKKNKKENKIDKIIEKVPRDISIIEGALSVFGQKGYEDTKIADICKAANISEATLYEYFKSKEDVLFSIPEVYTTRSYDHFKDIIRYVESAKEKMKIVIWGYLDFYENHKLYTSVALLLLKGNRKFTKTKAYAVIRKVSRSIVEVFKEGVSEGVFRDDIDPYLVRNMVLGFIEHITIQWLVTGRPESILSYRTAITDMIMRSIERKTDEKSYTMKIELEDISNRLK